MEKWIRWRTYSFTYIRCSSERKFSSLPLCQLDHIIRIHEEHISQLIYTDIFCFPLRHDVNCVMIEGFSNVNTLTDAIPFNSNFSTHALTNNSYCHAELDEESSESERLFSQLLPIFCCCCFMTDARKFLNSISFTPMSLLLPTSNYSGFDLWSLSLHVSFSLCSSPKTKNTKNPLFPTFKIGWPKSSTLILSPSILCLESSSFPLNYSCYRESITHKSQNYMWNLK